MESRSPFRILLVGKGGRESALAFKLSQSPRVERIFVVPGNGGTCKEIEKVSNVAGISEMDFPRLLRLAKGLRIRILKLAGGLDSRKPAASAHSKVIGREFLEAG